MSWRDTIAKLATCECVVCNAIDAERKRRTEAAVVDPARPHIVGGEFQSDKYPTCPRGKVPLSVKDLAARDLLWIYAQRRRAVDAEFAADLEFALRAAGYVPPLEVAPDDYRIDDDHPMCTCYAPPCKRHP